MNIKPLTERVYNTAVDLRVEIIKLNFSSNGQGHNYLDVELEGRMKYPYDDYKLSELIKDVKSWAWNVYSYKVSGNSNRTASGESIAYDLNNKVAHTKKWWHERQERETYGEAFTIEKIEE